MGFSVIRTNMVPVYQYVAFPTCFNCPFSSFTLFVAFYKAGTKDDSHSPWFWRKTRIPNDHSIPCWSLLTLPLIQGWTRKILFWFQNSQQLWIIMSSWCIQRIHQSVRSCVTFRNKILFLRWRFVSPTPNPQAGGPPVFGCSWLLIQYICSYP
jgi:hypothetical protein